MVRLDMRYKMPHAPRYFLAVLCLSASFIVPAAAADATFLPDIPAEQIAADTARSYDSRTGVSIVTAPTFDPFEQDDTVAGTAALRTGPSETTIDGARVVGGAYLDLKMIYTSPSDDPYDLRGYERAYYVSGDPVARITQDVKTLDCASNTTEVVYQDDYYDRYDSYGYLAGIYMLLPRYRGHRGYWSGRTRHRPFSGWSGWRKRAGYGNYGASYGYDYGYDGRGFSRRGYDGHDGSRTGRRGDDESRGRGTGGRSGSGNGSGNSAENGSDTRHENARKRHSGANSIIGGSRRNRSYQRQRGVVYGEPLSNGRSDTQRESRNTRRELSREDRSRVGVRDRGRGSNPLSNTTRQPTARTGRPAIRETVSGSNRRSNPAGVTPRPVTRSAPTISAPAPQVRQSRRQNNRVQNSKKANIKRVSKPRPSKRESRKLDRAVDRSFRNNNRARRGKQMEFFPMQAGFNRVSSSLVTTNYRCVREETVTLHIPQERLDAARFDGLTLVIVDNADRDVPVYLPPNYIEGFRQAARGGSFSSSSTTIVTPQPSYTSPAYTNQQGYPQN
jgi:hypothetical protein